MPVGDETRLDSRGCDTAKTSVPSAGGSGRDRMAGELGPCPPDHGAAHAGAVGTAPLRDRLGEATPIGQRGWPAAGSRLHADLSLVDVTPDTPVVGGDGGCRHQRGVPLLLAFLHVERIGQSCVPEVGHGHPSLLSLLPSLGIGRVCVDDGGAGGEGPGQLGDTPRPASAWSISAVDLARGGQEWHCGPFVWQTRERAAGGFTLAIGSCQRIAF